MKIIIELQDNYKHWPKGRIKKLNKWLNDLTLLMTDGSFMNYTKTVMFEGLEDEPEAPMTDHRRNDG